MLTTLFDATADNETGRCDIGVQYTFSGYFDDELWWGLGWLKAYNLTQNASYLERSEAIFGDVATRAWNESSCGGGVCWQAANPKDEMHGCYKNVSARACCLPGPR